MLHFIAIFNTPMFPSNISIYLFFHFAPIYTGVHPVTYWCCNFIADSAIVFLSLLSVFSAVMIGGEPVREYFLNSTQSEYQGKIFLECISVFSFAVVASSYAFSVRSSDQLSSQLLMLISTVAGGVFLKLYLDRHSGPFFAFLSSIFLWFSPCFTFATCMFDLFALRGAQMSLEFGAAVGAQIRTSIAAVYRCLSILLFQILFYMTITITVDCHWAKVIGVINHVRFLLSLPLRFKVVADRKAQPVVMEMTDADYRSQNYSAGSSHSLIDIHQSNPSSFHFLAQNGSEDEEDDDEEEDSGRWAGNLRGMRKGTGIGMGSRFGSRTPLVHTAHRSYDSAQSSLDLDLYGGYPPPSSSASRPTVSLLNSPSSSPSVTSGHQCGLGIRRVLQAHGTVYGEIGMFPGIRNMKIGLLKQKEKASRCRGGGRVEGSVDGKTALEEDWDIESNVLNSKMSRKKYSNLGSVNDSNIDKNSTHYSVKGANRGDDHDTNNDFYSERKGPSSDDIVEARGLFVEYSFGSKRKIALNGLDFEIKKGERVALLG